MSFCANLNSKFEGVKIDDDGCLICSCELKMKLRPNNEPKFWKCPKAYEPTQCSNHIWLNEEAEVRKTILQPIPQTPVHLAQPNITLYFRTPSTNSDRRGSPKIGTESSGRLNRGRENSYGPTSGKRLFTPTPLPRTPSKKTKAGTPLLPTPDTGDQHSAQKRRFDVFDSNYDLGSPCSKKQARNVEDKENAGFPVTVESQHQTKSAIEIYRDEDDNAIIATGGQTTPVRNKVRTYIRSLNEVRTFLDSFDEGQIFLEGLDEVRTFLGNLDEVRTFLGSFDGALSPLDANRL